MAAHPEIISSHFDSLGDYGKIADSVVPHNRELHNIVFREISSVAKGEFKMLDLGVGAGETDRRTLEKFSGAKVVGIDISPRMCERASQNLKRFGNRARIIKGNFEMANLGYEYDLVVSEVAVHNSTDREKKRLFKRILDALKGQGAFINGDFIAGEDLREEEKFKREYFDFLKKALSGQDLEAWVRHAFYEDKPAKISDQLRWLSEAGFKRTEILWKKDNLAVYVAFK